LEEALIKLPASPQQLLQLPVTSVVYPATASGHGASNQASVATHIHSQPLAEHRLFANSAERCYDGAMNLYSNGDTLMTSLIPDSHRDLLDRPIIVALATTMPDNTIQVTPVWCSYDGTHIIVNATAVRQKHRNMRDRPHVTV